MKKFWPFILIIILAFLPLIDLFHPGLPITHDGQDHVARIANFYQNLVEGVMIPRWAANLNWGYGHPILMFLYPFPSYLASLFHLLGFNFVDSVKIVFAVAFISSGIAMYIWVDEFLDRYSALVGAILYMYAPYRFVDLYVRGAIGEHMAFVFPPLIFYFLLKLSKQKKTSLKDNYFLFAGAALSMAGLILAHNAITIMFLPFLALYILYLYFFTVSKKNIVVCICSVILGFVLSSFFLLPAFFEGKYTLRDIVTGKDYIDHFVMPVRFLYGQWSYGGSGQFSVQIGAVHIIGVIVSLILLLRSKTKKVYSLLYALTFLYFLGSLFLMIPQSLFIYKTITTLQKFQFPWRFLTITVFSSALLCAFSVFLIKVQKIKLVLCLTFIVAALMFYFQYGHPKGYLNKGEIFYTTVYNGTTDTGESAPIWSVRFMEKRPRAKMQFITGNGSIKEEKRTSTYHRYLISANNDSRIVENTLYFPGWNIYIDNVPTKLEFQDPRYRGLMTFNLPSGNHLVEVKFQETKLRLFSDVLSLVGVSILVLMGIVRMLKKNK